MYVYKNLYILTCSYLGLTMLHLQSPSYLNYSFYEILSKNLFQVGKLILLREWSFVWKKLNLMKKERKLFHKNQTPNLASSHLILLLSAQQISTNIYVLLRCLWTLQKLKAADFYNLQAGSRKSPKAWKWLKWSRISKIDFYGVGNKEINMFPVLL